MMGWIELDVNLGLRWIWLCFIDTRPRAGTKVIVIAVGFLTAAIAIAKYS